jgi:hypothetical protein
VNYQRVLKGCMWVAIAVGAYARLRGLGTWPLAIDEYFIVQSVDNILQHGVPAFPCGGYYMRGLTLQYLIAPLFALGITPALAARLVTVAFSFAMLPAVYFLGKRLSGVTVACISVGLLSISLWEIEFARYARMYIPFQAIFLWYLLALQRVVVDRKSASYGWLWLLSGAGMLTWEGGLFLLVTNFVPSVIERAPARARHLAVNTGLLLLGYLYSAWNFRFMGSQPALPPNVPIETGGSRFTAPPLLASTLSPHPAWMIGALALLFVSLVAIVQLARTWATARERLAWAALVVLSLFNLFGCVLIGLTLALLLEWIDIRRASRRSMLIAIGPIAANFVFWLTYALLTHSGQQLFPGFGPGGELSKLAVVLFKYPNVFNSILYPWLAAVPALTIALGGLLVLALAWAIFARDGERLSSLRLMLAVCVIMLAMVGVAETKFIKTRYTFFILPVLYLVGVSAAHRLLVHHIRGRLKRGAVLGLAILALVGLTEDFGWAHMVHVDRMAWNYRLPLDQALTEHYYRRWDNRTPAEFVNHRVQPEDVIITTQLPVAYYLKRTDYVYRNFHDSEFAALSCDAGQRERWTGRHLLYRTQDLFNVIDTTTGNTWLIVRLPWDQKLQRAIKKQYSAKLVDRGRAGKIGVYKINKSR